MNISEFIKRSVSYTGLKALSIIQTTSGSYYVGVRIESEVYPLSIESAQAAIGIVLCEGQKPHKIWSYAINKDGDAVTEYSAGVYAQAFGIQHMTLPVNFNPKLASIHISNSFETLYEEKATSQDFKYLATQSNYQVRAWTKTERGWILGHNFEHTFLALGLCAERVALAKALTYNLGKIEELYIDTAHQDIAQPCGACRQLLSEICDLNTPLSLLKEREKVQTNLLSDYLPYPFDPDFDKKMHF
jgi:homotetrameric cytidine deaminase